MRDFRADWSVRSVPASVVAARIREGRNEARDAYEEFFAEAQSKWTVVASSEA